MKIEFEYQTEYGVYRDALYLSDDEPLPYPYEIEAMKLERLHNWIAAISQNVSEE